MKKKAKAAKPVKTKTDDPVSTTHRERPPVILVEEVPSRCPRCNSTQRTCGDNFRTRDIVGQTQDGTPYNLVKWFYTACRDCGQRYRIIRRENVTAGHSVSTDK